MARASHIYTSFWAPVLLTVVAIVFFGSVGIAEAVFPTVEATQKSTETSNTSSHTVDLPSGISDGDLILIIASFVVSEGDPTPSTPSGWTQLYNHETSNIDNAHAAFYRVADGTEGSTETISTGGSVRSVHHTYLINAYQGTPEVATSTNTNSSSPDPPSLSPSWGSGENLWLAVGVGIDNGSNVSITGYPTNYSNGTASGVSATSLGTARRTLEASSDNPGTFSISSSADDVKGATIAIEGATIGTPGVTFTTSVQVNATTSVVGTIAKGSGTFAIDHPLDPKNKLLYHSFVESDEAKNIYDGIVELDEDGEARITLDDWFLPLNRDFRYLATPIRQPMPNLHITKEIEPWFFGLFGRPVFAISGGEPGGRVSWQVTGIRHDPYIEANPIEVEVEKGPEEIVDKGECIFGPLCQQ